MKVRKISKANALVLVLFLGVVPVLFATVHLMEATSAQVNSGFQTRTLVGEVPQALTNTPSTPFDISADTGEKPQSKVWFYSDRWWAVMPSTSISPMGTWLWRLEANGTWINVLQLSSETDTHADTKVMGAVTHVLLYGASPSLVSIEYVPASTNYQPWVTRPAATPISLPGSETATIDVDSTGRMWLSTENGSDVNVYYSGSPYSTFTGPINLANNIGGDDISDIIAMPGNKIGVLWSNQTTQRFGFKIHLDADPVGTWSADEVPASQSAESVGLGMADDHLNMKVAADGTIYAAVKTSYDTAGYPKIALLIRRPTGTWDNLHEVDQAGTRANLLLNETEGKIRVVYTSNEGFNDIIYKESPISSISFGAAQTLITGGVNNVTTAKANWSNQVVVLASSATQASGVLIDNGLGSTPVGHWRMDEDGGATLLDSSGLGNNAAVTGSPSWTDQSKAGLALTTSGTTTGTADYGVVPDNNSLDLTNAITLAAWIKPSKAAFATQNIIKKTLGTTTANGYELSLSSSGKVFVRLNGNVNYRIDSTTLYPLNSSAWMHVATTYDGTNIRLYINGIQEGGDKPMAIPIGTNSTNFGIGVEPAGTPINFFEGQIDEVRVYGQALSASEIQSLQTNIAPVVGAGSDDIITLPSSANLSGTASDDGLPAPTSLTTTWSKLSGPGIVTFGNATSLSTTASFSVAGTYVLRLTAYDGSVFSWDDVQITVSPAAGPAAPVGYWPMDEGSGTQILDSSGLGNNGNLGGNPTWSTDRINGPFSLNLDGTGDYALVPDSASLDISTGITMAAWVKPSASTTQYLIKKAVNGGTPATNDGFELGLSTVSTTPAQTPFVRFNQASAGNGFRVNASSQYPADGNTWMHIAATWDGTTTRIYINGVEEGTGAFAGPINLNALPLGIGSDSGGGSTFTGLLDDVRLYGQELSPAEILVLANAPPTVDAGIDQNVTLPADANLTGAATDDGNPAPPSLTTTWSQFSGPGTATFGDPNALTTTASFTQDGVYVLRLTADDGVYQRTDDVQITVAPATAGGFALQFDGTNDYVTFGPNLNAVAFTLEAWVKRNAGGATMSTGSNGLDGVSGRPLVYPVLTKGMGQGETPANINMNWFLGITNTGVVGADFEDNAGGVNHPAWGSTTIPVGEWHHIAAAYDGACWTILVDGALDTLNGAVTECPNATPEFNSIQHAGLAAGIGSTGQLATGFFAGTIDEARVWNLARSQTEIFSTVNSEITSGSGLIARWGMNEGTGTTINSSISAVPGTLTNGPVWVTPGAPFNIAPANPPDEPTVNAPADAATGIGTSPTLDVGVSDPDGGPLTVTFYGRPYASGVFTQIAQNTGVASGSNTIVSWTSLDEGQKFEWYVTVSDGAFITTGPTWTFKTVAGTDPVFVGIGDIASCSTTNDNLTGDIIAGIDGVIFTTGDNVYPNGTAADFTNCYDPTPWGSPLVKSRTRPVPGNHDWGTGVTNNLDGYNGYFGANATDAGGKSYYSYDIGTKWHVVNLDSECQLVPGGCGAGSAQEIWLNADLAANSTKNVIAVWHKPRYSSGITNYQALQPLWDALYNAGADIVLNGHDHVYERFAPMKSGATLSDPPVADPTFGIHQFTVGLGGESFHNFSTILSTSIVRNNNTFGIFKLTLHDTSFDWEYLPVAGGTFSDSGTASVHASPSGSTSVSFQDGVNSYAGTRDTYTYDTSPTTVRGGELTMVQDKGSGIDNRKSLLSFDLSSIPANATILSADLEFYVDTEGQGFDMHRMKVPWDEATVTYASIGNRHFLADDIDAESTVDANWCCQDGYVGSITVASTPNLVTTTQGWVDGTLTNNGWLMIATDVDDGQQLRTREYGTVAHRPKLSVVYNVATGPTVPDAPNSVSAIGGDASAQVMWTTPAFDGGSPITDYQITPYIGATPQTPILVGSAATSFNVTGLTNGTTYTFKVAAINSVGTGPDSAASNSVTPSLPVDNWTTYADLRSSTGDANAANVLEIPEGAAGTPIPTGTSYTLLDLSSGLDTDARLQIDNSDINTSSPNGASFTGGPAFAVFGGIVDGAGVYSFNEETDVFQLNLSGLDPFKRYTIALSTNRDQAASPERWTDLELLGVVSSTEASGGTTTVVSPTRVRFESQNNTVRGDLARWTNIDPGADGAFSVKTNLFLQGGTDRSYAPVQLMLQETVVPVSDSALDFGGTNAYVNLGNPAKLHLSTFTIETRFRRDGTGVGANTGNGGINPAIPLVTRGVGEAENTNADTNYFLGIDGASNTIAADFEEGAGGTSPSLNHPIIGNTVITNGVWHHAAATYDGNKWQIYLDGVLETELIVGEPVAAAGNQTAAIASALPVSGTPSGNSGFFDGAIDEVRIWNYAQTPAEIRSNANSAITSGTGLVGRWGLNEGTGTDIGDSTSSPANGTITGANWSWIGPSPVINLAPLVDAGPDQNVSLAAGATLAGTITDDGLLNTATANWSQVSGPGTTGFGDATAVNSSASFPVDGTYVLRLTADDGANSRSDDVTIIVTGTTATMQFQEGVNGYSGTEDTYLRATQPTTSQGNAEEVGWDLDEGTGGGPQYSLVKFNNLFGTGSGQIPAGVFITSATLTYTVFDTGDPADVNEASVAWDETTTFDQFGGEPDVQPDEYGNFVGSASGSSNGAKTVEVTSSLQSWYAGSSANNGWIFRPTAGGGVDFRSSEYTGSANERPMLSITYSTVQPNRAPDMPTMGSPTNGTTGVSTSPTLNVSVSDPDGDPLTVTYYGREVTSTPGPDFTIVALPDTQFYSSELNGGTAAMFSAQTQWIVNERASRNIVFVTQLGDCVQNGDNGGNPVEWDNADAAMSLLENPATTTLTDGIPYGIAVGNHDQSPVGDPNGTTNFFNQYFGTTRFNGRGYYGGHYGSNNDNHYQLFSASGMDFIIIHLEYDPAADPAVLAWANSLLQTYSSRRGILVSHHFVNTGNPAGFGTQGQATYDALKGNPNLFLMLNGHVSGEGRRQDTFMGNTVNSLLSDYQGRTNGGNGWLRIMTFSPSTDQIHVKTYSPTLNQFESDADSQFTLSYDMQGSGSGFTVIGTNTNVPGLTNDSIAWNNLNNSSKYEWYVTVDDGSLITTGPISQFDTISMEGDVAGRPNGDEVYLANDPQQVENFLIALDTFDPSKNEFQRADSAPYATKGDGIFNAADIQQAENYLISLDVPQEAGGPTAPSGTFTNGEKAEKRSISATDTESFKTSDLLKEYDFYSGLGLFESDPDEQLLPRVVRVNDVFTSAGQMVTVVLETDAEGDEAGYSFTLDYDSTKLMNPVVLNGYPGATIQSVNDPQGMAGKKTFSVRNFPGGTIAAGNNQVLVRVQFNVSPTAQPTQVPLTFSGTPTPNSVTNALAQTIPANFEGGNVNIAGPTAAAVTIAGRVFTQSGYGVFRALVQMTDVNGERKLISTNPFGYYRFENVQAGRTYFFDIFSKGHQFSTQVVTVNEELTHLNFFVQ